MDILDAGFYIIIGLVFIWIMVRVGTEIQSSITKQLKRKEKK